MVVHIDPNQFNRTCPRCGGNVHGAGATRCTSCGGSMVPGCVGCGYDLAGLARDAHCPECGTPVARSYAPDLLENRSPEFVRQLRAGLTMVIAGILGSIALLAIAFLLALTLGASDATVPGWDDALALVLDVALVGASILILLGWWKLTTPDPSRAGTDLDLKSRRIIRAAVLLRVVGDVAGLVPATLTLASPDAAMQLSHIRGAIDLAATVAWIVQFFAAMLYVQWLAVRIPDYKLRDDAKRFMWLGPVLCIAGCILLGLGPLIALALYLAMLFQLRAHLTTALGRLGAR